MLSAPKSSAQGATFIKAPNDSAFGKVLINNMDKNSFGDDMEPSTVDMQLASMILNGETAIFHSHEKIADMKKYQNCDKNYADCAPTRAARCL